MLDLTNSLREIGALSQSNAAALRSRAAALPTPEVTIGLAFVPGDRVLDLVTGQEGIVESGTANHIIIPAAQVTAG